MATPNDVSRPGEVGRASYSSSPGLSSPPSAHDSPTNISPSSHVLPSQNGRVDGITKAGADKASKLTLAKGAGATTGVKKTRKKRETSSKESKPSTTTTDAKEGGTKGRKTRGPSGTSSNPVGRKKKVVDVNHDTNPAPAPHLPRQSKITDPIRVSLPPPDVGAVANPSPPQNGNSEAIVRSNPSHNWPATTPRSSSGQNYDPIRSATIEPRTMSPNLHNAPMRSSTPPRPPQKYTSASASPSIASLIDANQAYNFPKPPKRADVRGPDSPNSKKPRLSPPPYIHDPVPKPTNRTTPAQTVDDNVTTAPIVDLDLDGLGPRIPVTLVKKSTSTGASSTAHSPKPSRPKQAPASLPSGNGLLSSAMFGGAYDNTGPEKTAPTVILNVSLDGGDNRYVNFARLAEERYGFNALHPRLAAQRERLARVAAAGAAIENAHKMARNSGSGVSADEMSVDLSENDGGGDDSNIEMGGTSYHDIEMSGLGRSGGEGSEATLVKKVPKKRLMKEDFYDKDDPFVDDAELAWEEQAAASKDGFFVYSGPLVPEGEKPNIER